MTNGNGGNRGPWQVIVDALYRAAIDPQSNLFLPKQIQGQTNPTYEPYVAGHWDAVNLAAGTAAAAAVCTDEPGGDYVVEPNTTPALLLSNVTIEGVSNAKPDPMSVNNDVVSASATLSTYDSSVAPTPLTVLGDFSLTQHCCPTDDFQTCSGPEVDFTGTGTFAVNILSSNVSATLLLGESGDNLTVTVQTLDWTASSDASNITATVDIESIPEDANRDSWDTYTEEALNSDEARAQLVVNVQQVLAQPSTLDSLSQLITNAINSILSDDAG
jgi:hypothetical protein